MARCPVLAKEYNIITIANMDSLQLSTYSREPGTRVKVSCLSNTFRVSGATTLTCLRSGSWDKPTPRCVNRRDFSRTQLNTSTTLSPVNPRKAEASSNANSVTSLAPFYGSITPYVITVCVLAVMFLSLVFILTYLVRMRKILNRKIDEVEEKERRPAHVRAVDSLRSLQSGSTTVYDYFRQTNSPTLSASNSSHSSNPRYSHRYLKGGAMASCAPSVDQRHSRELDGQTDVYSKVDPRFKLHTDTDASYFNSLDQRFRRERDFERQQGAYSHFDPRVKRARSHEILKTAHLNNFDQRFKRTGDLDTRSLPYTSDDDRWLHF